MKYEVIGRGRVHGLYAEVVSAPSPEEALKVGKPLVKKLAASAGSKIVSWKVMLF